MNLFGPSNAQILIDTHMRECADYRRRHSDDVRDLKSDVKDLRIDLGKQTKTLSLIVGGLIAISRVPDALTFLTHALK